MLDWGRESAVGTSQCISSNVFVVAVDTLLFVTRSFMVKRAFSANRRGRGAREGSGGMEGGGGIENRETDTESRLL